MVRMVDTLGRMTLEICNAFGCFSLFLIKALRVLCTTRLKFRNFLEHTKCIGVDSLTIILLTGTFTGMVLALQSYIGFHRFGAEQYIGTIIALSMARELGPVLTGLMVTGRAGSAIAAEIGTMEITEQIDALKTLGINPLQYLVVPRLLAGAAILPFLSLFCTACGIIGGYLMSIYVLNLSPEQYTSGIREYVVLKDITGGLVKASFFGLILTWVGSYKGYMTRGGARGVGTATTQSVVIGSILILIANYFLTALIF
jgi:phospholipid/cholesterol/gamma-HCH transport system permease protein